MCVFFVLKNIIIYAYVEVYDNVKNKHVKWGKISTVGRTTLVINAADTPNLRKDIIHN